MSETVEVLRFWQIVAAIVARMLARQEQETKAKKAA